MAPSETNINALQNKIWCVISPEEQGNVKNDYAICLNDIIKLGRVKYAVNEINLKTEEMDVDIDIDNQSKIEIIANI
jgi:hypothetical protein